MSAASSLSGSPIRTSAGDRLRRVVARFPSPASERAATIPGVNAFRDPDKYSTSETQTECMFPTWISVLAAQNAEKEKKQQQQQQNKKRPPRSQEEQHAFPDLFGADTEAALKKCNPVAEVEFMRRLHCQEYKQLQSLRELVRQHLTSLGATVYDVCAYKDVALTMKERFAVGPVADLVMLSSKLFRRCSDLSRSLGCFFNICFADDFCDRDFDFTDHRLSKMSLRRTEEQLKEVTRERDELRRRCHDAEAKVAEYGKSHEVLKTQRDDALARHAQLGRDMAVLFESAVGDVLKSEQENLRASDMALSAHQLVAPARSIAMQSVDNSIDKLSNVVSSLKTLHDDVSSVDFGGAMRTSIRNCDGLCTNVLTKLAHVRDGIKASADAMTTESQNRKRAVELSVLHVLAAEKMRAKLRDGREALDAVRSRALACSDLVRDARVKHVLRKQEEEKQRLLELEAKRAAAAAAGAADATANSLFDELGGSDNDGDDDDDEQALSAEEPFFGANEFSDQVNLLLHAISTAASTISHDEELNDVVDSLAARVPQVGGVAKRQVPMGRELLDAALSESAGGSAEENAFKQFAEMSQFMREMFEERIRELEEKKSGLGGADPSAAAGGKQQQQQATPAFSSSAEAENAKTDPEVLEDQAMHAIETWRKRRRAENNAGKLSVAEALRELDRARVKHERDRAAKAVARVNKNANDNDDDDDDWDEDDVAEAPSLVIDVSQIM